MTPNEAFRSYLFSLPVNERLSKLRDLQRYGNKPYSFFYNRFKNISPIDVAWQDKIEEILEVKIFNNTTNS